MSRKILPIQARDPIKDYLNIISCGCLAIQHRIFSSNPPPELIFCDLHIFIYNFLSVESILMIPPTTVVLMCFMRHAQKRKIQFS